MANAIVERRFHTVESNVHAVMSDMAVPMQYFEEIWKGVVCIHNRLPDQLRERHPHPRPPITHHEALAEFAEHKLCYTSNARIFIS